MTDRSDIQKALNARRLALTRAPAAKLITRAFLLDHASRRIGTLTPNTPWCYGAKSPTLLARKDNLWALAITL